MANITIPKNSHLQITKNINSDELQCPCNRCATMIYNPEHIKKLQAFRDKFGKPVHINSGYRCPDHNKEVGGEPNSFHMKGDATDITIQGMTPLQVQDEADKEFDGMGRYDTFCHVDSRGFKSRWDFRKSKPVQASNQLPEGPSEAEINDILKELE